MDAGISIDICFLALLHECASIRFRLALKDQVAAVLLWDQASCGPFYSASRDTRFSPASHAGDLYSFAPRRWRLLDGKVAIAPQGAQTLSQAQVDLQQTLSS